LAVGGVAMAQQKSTPPARWEPVRHDQDDWLDQPASKHRLLFDTITSDGLAEALAFAGNFIRVNKTVYGLEDNEVAVIIIVRHRSTPFGFNDAMWAKYGTALARFTPIEDPKTKAAPQVNIYNSADYGNLPNHGTTFESLAKQGVQVGVCSVATRGLAGMIAGTVSGNADAINSELIANLVPNARMVPAGIVAVNRAQERGYTLG
jgi:intracellular sulfur oxidation DsrE/DsrF family protein